MRKFGFILLVIVEWIGCSQDNSILNDLTAQIDTLQKEVHLLKASLDSLGQLNLTIDTLNDEIGVLQQRMDGLNNLKAQVDFLDSQVKVQANQKSLNELRAEIDLLNNQLRNLVSQIDPNEITLGKDGAKMVLISVSTNSLLGLVSVPTFCEKISLPFSDFVFSVILLLL